MSEGRRPIGRITVRNVETKVEKTVATIWPDDFGEGNGRISLGSSAYKDNAEITADQALALMAKGSTKGSGYFINYRVTKTEGEQPSRGRRGRPAPQAEPDEAPENDTDNLEDLPF